MFLTQLANYAIHIISASGYYGIFLLNFISSTAIPIPSEVFMPFSGFLAYQGHLALLAVILTGAIGSVFGSLVLYYIGYFGGRPLIEKYGKYILMHTDDLARADKFFAKYGDLSNFFGRMLPIVRSFISFPAGVSRMNLKKFILYAFLGSLVWSAFLTLAGYFLGQHWDQLGPVFHQFDYIFIGLIAAGIIWFVSKHLRKR